MPGTESMVRYSILVVLVAVLSVSFAASAKAQKLARVDGPLTVDRAVELALAESLRVRAARADSQTMDSMRREAQAPFWPQFSANGYFANQNMAPNVYTSAGNTMARNYQVFGADQNRDGNVTGMYSIFAGGRDYYTYRAAAHRADAGREMLRGTEVDVAMQARLDYIAAVRETDGLQVLADLLRNIDERLRVTREQFDAGRVPRYYVVRDEAERANVVQMQAMTQSRADLALVALKTTLGIDLASAVTLSERLDYAAMTLSIPEGIREASQNQPELKAAVKQREAAEAEVRAAYGNYFPQVSLSTMYDWLWSKNRNDSKMSDNGYSVGVVVTLPLFDGLLRENALNTAKSKLERAVQAEGLVRQQIAKDVNQAALMLTAADKGVTASRAGLDFADEDFRVVRERFESGRGIQVEVLDAQVALTRARFNIVTALADYHIAQAMWLKAIGRVR